MTFSNNVNLYYQLGSFWIEPKVYRSYETLRSIQKYKIYLNAGTFEKSNYNHTKEFAQLLKSKGFSLKEEYFNQGHSWGLWKETFASMLEFLLNQ